jgi:hypothetical protein
MKVAILSLIALSSLVHRADSQSFVPTAAPTISAEPTGAPTGAPTGTPVAAPTGTPTTAPTISAEPTGAPTGAPTGTPTAAPTGTPTAAPTISAEPTAAPTAPECYTNLDDIGAKESAVFDSTVHREYILCPNTQFSVGQFQGLGNPYFRGSQPIIVRRNTAYKCGNDGKSSNNCNIFGGTFQFLSSELPPFGPPQWPTEPHTNVTISGLTFEAGTLFTTVFQNPGDVTFADCIFQVSAVAGALEISKRSTMQYP